MFTKAVSILASVLVAQAMAEFPAFKEHVINAEAGTGLAITVADVNKDSKPDIVGVSADDVAWYENPTWERHLIAGTIRNSNVWISMAMVFPNSPWARTGSRTTRPPAGRCFC